MHSKNSHFYNIESKKVAILLRIKERVSDITTFSKISLQTLEIVQRVFWLFFSEFLRAIFIADQNLGQIPYYCDRKLLEYSFYYANSSCQKR